MKFKKLTEEDDGLYINSKKPFVKSIDLSDFVNEVAEFAWGMTFGREGQHRDHRTGGQYSRKNGELFINVFQGKLCEFGIWRDLKSKGFEFSRPDLDKWPEGKWDKHDFKIENKGISIKSTTSKGNLLLLETKDWDTNGEYIPNIDTDNSSVDFHVFCRINPDGKQLMKDNHWFYSNNLDKNDLFKMLGNTTWTMDIPGFITREDLRFLIENDFKIEQNIKLNGWLPMDANNYYCQAGDMREIDELIESLKS